MFEQSSQKLGMDDHISHVYQSKSKLLKFYVSDIASIADCHYYSSFLETFHKYIYQSLADLYFLDLNILGIVEVEPTLDDLSHILSAGQLSALKSVCINSEINGKYSNSKDVKQAVTQVKSIFASVDKTKLDSITLETIKLLENESTGNVYKRYGQTCESSVLNHYHTITGYPVDQRNESSYTWSIPRDNLFGEVALFFFEGKKLVNPFGLRDHIRPHISTSKPGASIDSAASGPNALDTHPTSLSAVPLLDISTSVDLTLDSTDLPATSTGSTQDGAAFYIVGRVDGISEQYDRRHPDPVMWTYSSVVIEAKSRATRIQTSPSIHDQIQLVTYMLMHGTTCGDLIQTIATASSEEPSNRSSSNNKRHKCDLTVTSLAVGDPPASRCQQHDVSVTIDLTGEDEVPPLVPTPTASVSPVRSADPASPFSTTIPLNMPPLASSSDQPSLVTSSAPPPQAIYDASTFHIHRIDLLHDPAFNHAYHYFTTILPRLRQFNAAVHRMRQDDVMRWSYLLASDADRLSLLAGLCDYFDPSKVKIST